MEGNRGEWKKNKHDKREREGMTISRDSLTIPDFLRFWTNYMYRLIVFSLHMTLNLYILVAKFDAESTHSENWYELNKNLAVPHNILYYFVIPLISQDPWKLRISSDKQSLQCECHLPRRYQEYLCLEKLRSSLFSLHPRYQFIHSTNIS